MKMDKTKQRISILGKTVLRRTVEAFERCRDVDAIIVVTRRDEVQFVKEECDGIRKLIGIALGGKTRAESARNGFLSMSGRYDFVAIHDAARCLVTEEIISRVISDANTHGGAASAVSYATDTVKIIDTDRYVVSTPDRNFVVMASTPQVFSTDIYTRALKNTNIDDCSITDDNMLVEKIGIKVYCTDVGRDNLKITTGKDIEFAELVLKGREQCKK